MSKQRKRSSSPFSPKAQRNGKNVHPPGTHLQIAAPQPANDDLDAWPAYWQTQGYQWRTQPEIDANRQNELHAHRSVVPDIMKGLYPFKNVKPKLTRADIEWLLTTHENGRGPIDWNDESQREREGLDLRGTDLRGVDLSRLPLAKTRFGLTYQERALIWRRQRRMSTVHLEKANLFQTHLEGATFLSAHLEEATLEYAHLEKADLAGAHLEQATLHHACLDGAYLQRAFFDNGTFLNAASLGNEKVGFVSLVDVRWGGVNLAPISWSHVRILGDEKRARQRKTNNGDTKNITTRCMQHELAIRANRQLAKELQSQGLDEEAARFAYRAQVLQKHLFWFEMFQSNIHVRKRVQGLSAWLSSWFLYLIAGYGYRSGRSFLAYLLVISGFATAYYFLGHRSGPMLSPLGAFVFSMTSFHGRGFFPGNNISLDDPLTVLAALEALVGLIIEVTFIATLTQRFFNR